MPDVFKSKALRWTLFILLCGCWFYTLGARTLVPTDEGRYAEMAREMLASGDWITPRLNAIKYFEKPPLQIWMTALAFKAFGLGEWQARLWTGLCGLLGIFMVGWTGRRVFNPQVGAMAAMVLGSSFLWVGLGHINTLDMSLSGMMTLALCGLLLGQHNDASARERRNGMLLCWAGMALAVLSKGLIGVILPGAVLVLYTLLARDWAIWKRLHLALGLLVFFAITTPWFLLVSLKNPEFAHFFFIHEHFERFTTKVHSRDGPWYYFIPILLLGVLPWLTVLGQSVWQGWRNSSSSGFQPKKMLLIWAGFIFFFFSISHSKLPSYILPIIPALALLIALHLQDAGRMTWRLAGGLMALLGVTCAVLAPQLSRSRTDALDRALYSAAEPAVMAGALVLFACGALVFWWARRPASGPNRELNLRACLLLAIGGFLCEQLILLATEPYGYVRSGRPLVAAIEAELGPGVKLYSVGLYDQTLPFYLRRTSTLVAHADELDFGLDQQPELWYPKLDGFVKEWNKGRKMVAITRDETYDDLLESGAKMRIVTRDARRIVIANDLQPNSPP